MKYQKNSSQKVGKKRTKENGHNNSNGSNKSTPADHTLDKEFLIGIRDNFFIFEKTKLPFYKNGTYLK